LVIAEDIQDYANSEACIQGKDYLQEKEKNKYVRKKGRENILL
jgi:hypothetical protein